MNDAKPDNPVVQEIVEEKKAQIESVVDSIQLTATQDITRRIINLAKSRIDAYYREYPERALDDRGHQAVDWFVVGLRDALRMLSEYNIERKNTGG